MRWTRCHILKYTKQNLKACVGWLMLISAKTLLKTLKTLKYWGECIYKKIVSIVALFQILDVPRLNLHVTLQRDGI